MEASQQLNRVTTGCVVAFASAIAVAGGSREFPVATTSACNGAYEAGGVAEFVCRFRLDQIVDSGGTAQMGRFGNVEQFACREFVEAVPWAPHDALGCCRWHES